MSDAKPSEFYTRASGKTDNAEFYKRLEEKHTAPLWEVLASLVTPEPRPQSVPTLWKYDEIRPLLMEAGTRITAREAERRVLILQNPGLRGLPQITQSLYAGVQLILPGEVAASHRHVASALRFVLESNGAYTAVDGERTTMRPGDFILTPSWTFHDHGNETDSPAIWLDGLDVPIVNLFDTSFAEHYPDSKQPLVRDEGDALARYGSNLLPLEHRSESLTAPIFNYPYSKSREALDRLYRNSTPHECHGIKMQYSNPVTGGYPMPTIGAFLQLLPAGFSGKPYRSTDASVFCCVEGRGASHIGDTAFRWEERDIFVVPSWCPASHSADTDSVLFSFSDRPAQKALGLWRESTV